MADLIIAKHRSGGTGDVRLRFVKEFARFENPPQLGMEGMGMGMPQNASFDQQGGSMIVDSKMNEDNGLGMAPDGDVPF